MVDTHAHNPQTVGYMTRVILWSYIRVGVGGETRKPKERDTQESDRDDHETFAVEVGMALNIGGAVRVQTLD
jgi:hypothetical protein